MMEGKQMNFKDYQQAALRTAGDNPDIRNCQLGLAGEAGEFADLIKKWAFHGHELDKDKALKELGDVLWYAAVTCHIRQWDADIHGVMFSPRECDADFIDSTIELSEVATELAYSRSGIFVVLRLIEELADYLGSSLEEVMRMNVDKLMARYPEGFDSNRSINREE